MINFDPPKKKIVVLDNQSWHIYDNYTRCYKNIEIYKYFELYRLNRKVKFCIQYFKNSYSIIPNDDLSLSCPHRSPWSFIEVSNRNFYFYWIFGFLSKNSWQKMYITSFTIYTIIIENRSDVEMLKKRKFQLESF